MKNCEGPQRSEWPLAFAVPSSMRVVRRMVLVVRATDASRRRVRAVARWARALVPAAALVITPFDGFRADPSEDDAITIDADEVASGPLALADAIARAMAAKPAHAEQSLAPPGPR